MLRVAGRNSFCAEFTVLRSHTSRWNRRAEKALAASLRARRKNRLLRIDGTASRLECRRAANQGGKKGRQVRSERHQSVDNQWLRRGCGNCLRQLRSIQRRKRNYRPGGGKRHAGISRGQGRKINLN